MKKFKLVTTPDGKNYLLPFVLITTLFFLWGFAHSFLDGLNKHFQETLSASKTQSALVQFMVYGGYFLMALPAGQIIKRAGYRAGVLTGLVLYAVGALLFIPGGQLNSFNFFLLSLFIIGCGLTCLETAANPYATVLGEPSSAERRINLAQSFNGLGWIVGPAVGGVFLFSAEGAEGVNVFGMQLPGITIPYAVVGLVVLLVAVVFSFVRLPQIVPPEAPVEVDAEGKTSLWSHRNFTVGLVALFLYVAAQTGINSFFINYATENTAMSNQTASFVLAFVCMALFMLGRVVGSWGMKYIRAERVLQLCAVMATAGTCLVMALPGTVGLGALFVVYLCESIMFPTIFALAIRGVGGHTEMASSLLIMSIVGGAVAPLLMGWLADTYVTATGFAVPLVCFVFIAYYGRIYKQLK